MKSRMVEGDNKHQTVHAIYRLVISVLVIGIGLGCWLLIGCFRNVSTISINGIDIKVKEYSLEKLDYETLPQGHTGRSTISLEDLEKIVELPTITYENQEGYHPVRIARLLLSLLNSYKVTGGQAYLEKARFISDKYVNTATELNGAIYLGFIPSTHKAKGQRIG